MDKVKEVIEKNRQRKITKHKKLSNNTIIEIDNFSPLELLKLQINLAKIANDEGITFTTGKGQKKSEIQILYEEIEASGNRLLKYKEHYKLMGTDRNSYSKTDIEGTFNDYMRNGELKPAYNVQIAVKNYFIIHSYISNDRTDYNTLIPVLEKHHKAFGFYPKEVTADSGYSSEQNLSYLKKQHIKSYIKLQTHEKMKTRAYQKDSGKYYNMTKIQAEETHYYRCHDGRQLQHEKEQKPVIKGTLKEPLKCMGVAIVYTNQTVYTNMMKRNMSTRTRS